jgi:2,4-dienoyl-CoA reductase-like NADH-dependent reductase (Old Yellow Enzyme family)
MTTLKTPLQIGTMLLNNRLYRAPVLEGAGGSDDPAAIYAKHFVPNAKAGVGLIIQGNTIVVGEGRTSPGMNVTLDEKDILAYAPMVRAVQAHGTKIVIQLGHGGLFAVETWHKPFRRRATQLPWAPSLPPWWLRAAGLKVHVLSTEEVEALIERFGQVAAWARAAGYDGVQLAGANAKLLHQFLSPTFNRRSDRFGGSVDNRARILVEIRRAIARTAGEAFPVLLKYTAVEDSLFGFGQAITLADGIAIARIAEKAGFAAVTPVVADATPNTAIARGSFPTSTFKSAVIRGRYAEAMETKLGFLLAAGPMALAALRFPFTPVWNEAIFSAVKAQVAIPVFAVGGIRDPERADALLESGAADMIGVGRPFYAEPELAARFLAHAKGASFTPLACESCNQCIPAQMLGMPGVCYNPGAQKRRARLRMASPHNV